MRHARTITISTVLGTMLGIVCLAPAPASAGVKCESVRTYCPGKGWVKSSCDSSANPCGSGDSTPGSGYDYGAARRAQEAEVERQRQQAEAERIERERLAEEKRKNEEFIRNRDAAVNTLRGSTGTSSPQLKGISSTDNYALKGSGTDPGSQLKSVERSSRDAQEQASERKDTARETARMGFDTPGEASGNLVYPDKKQRQIPPTALDKRVPAEAQKDPQVQQSLAWYRRLDAEKAEKEKMIAEIEEKQKTSKDPVLETKIATLNNDVKRVNGDQAKVMETVKKQVKNLGFDLVESTEPTTTEASKK